MSSPVGHSVEDMAVALAKLKGITVDDALKFLGGKAFADQAQNSLTGMIGRAGGATKLGGAAGRLAGSKIAHGALRAAAGKISALDVADVVTNNTSLGNKAMDATAMAIGAALGSVAGLPTMGETGKQAMVCSICLVTENSRITKWKSFSDVTGVNTMPFLPGAT